MSLNIATLTASIALASTVFAIGATTANAGNDRAVDQYTCKEVMRETGLNRNAAIAFLHGYILGTSGDSKFNIETLTKQTDAFIDSCLDKPGDKAVDVMMKVKN